MSVSSRSGAREGILRPLLFGIAAILLVYGFFGMIEVFDAWQNRREENLKKSLRLELDRIIAARATGNELLDAAWVVHDVIQSGSGRNTTLRRHIHRLEHDFGGKFSLFVYQGTRNTLSYPENASHSQLVANLLSAVKAPASRRARLAPPLDREATALWGREVTVENLRRNNGGYVLLESSAGRGIAYFTISGSGLGEILLAENLPSPHVDAFLRHRAGNLRLHKRAGHGIPEIEFWVPPRGRSVKSLRLAWEKSQKEQQDTVEQNGILWTFDRDRTGLVTALTSPLPASRDIALLKSAGIFLILLLPFPLCGLQRRTGPVFDSLRTQMQALFLIATLLPMLSTLGVGWMLLDDQAERLRNAAFATCMTKLHTINAGFSRTQVLYKEKFKQLRKLVSNHPFAFEEFSQRFAPIQKIGLCQHLLIYDANNRVCLQKVEADRNDVIELCTMLSRSAIRRFIPERVGAGGQDKIKASDLMLEQMSSTEEFGWAGLFEVPNTSHRLQMGFSPAEVIWDIFPELASGPAFMVAMADSVEMMQFHLLHSLLTGEDAIRLLLLNGAAMELPPYLGKDAASTISTVMQTHLPTEKPGSKDASVLDRMRLWPARGTADRKALMTLMKVSHLTKRVLQREIRLASGTAWVVASPEPILGRFVTAAVLDAGQELSSLNGIRLALVIGLLVSLLTSFAAGHLLSALVLVPIGDLQGGIEAIRRRQADIVIPFRRDDEFGHLAKIFNHAHDELKELELARVVQICLLPAKIPDIDGYTLAAVNRSATDLSGDYYDLVRCQDGSILMVIGDVTGHGASAALAMAMARATVAYRLADGETEPSVLMTSLNDMFFRDLRGQRKFMTMLTVRLDPVAHLLKIETAGHNYPLLHVSSSRKTEYLPMIGFPLGARLKSMRDTRQVPLEPGDVFVMYTDGYTECLMPNSEQLGDNVLCQIVDTLAGAGKNAREILDGLLTEFDRLRAPGPLADDVTLVVLRRNK